MSVGAACLDDVEGQLAGSRLVEGDVEETGARNVHGVDTGICTQLFSEFFSKFPRWNSRLFGKLKGRVGRPVAVVAVLGSLDRELVGNRKVQAFVGQSLNGLFNCCFEIFRSHRVNDITPASKAANQVPRHRLSRERASLLGHPGASLLLEGLCVRRRLGNPGPVGQLPPVSTSVNIDACRYKIKELPA